VFGMEWLLSGYGMGERSPKYTNFWGKWGGSPLLNYLNLNNGSVLFTLFFVKYSLDNCALSSIIRTLPTEFDLEIGTPS
jgi:hypothetical protein